MSGVNKVIVIGRLGNDPEVRFTNDDKPVANFSVATSEKWTGGERTEWHKIVAWGKLAEICGEYLSKGREVYVEGKLQTSSWEHDGQTKYKTEIVAQNVHFLGGKQDSEGDSAF